MADITNTMNASASMNAGSGQIISSESPESVLSPGIREAMDLIFPKTTTQLLQRGFSFEEDKFLGVKASKENLHPDTTSASTLHVNALTLPCSISSAYITTITNTCTCTTASSEVVTSAHGNGSSTFSLSSFVSSFTPPLYPCAFKGQEETKISGVECKNLKLPRKNLGNIRNSKSDLEIITSDIAVNDESHGKASKKDKSADLSNKCDFNVDSESGDMMSPFSSIFKEKEKKKSESYNLMSGINVISGKHLTHLAKSLVDNDTQNLKPDSRSVVSPTDIIHNVGTSKENLGYESLLYDNVNHVKISHFNNQDSTSQSWIFKNGSLNDLHQNSGMAYEELSNNSFSSAKENIQNKHGKSKQSLPKIKQHYFNILKDKNKIRKTFLPCFVVIKNVSLKKPIKDLCNADSVLPLYARLDHLSDLCEKGSVSCRKRRFVIEEIVYKNIFEETVVVSDDDLENLRGRSLRKRDKHINYVEPSEDDILDDFSRKRSRIKHIDSTCKSEDESLGESKKRKKPNLSSSKTINSDSVTPVTITLPQNNKVKTKLKEKVSEAVVTNKYEVKSIKMSTVGPEEIIVYPPTSSVIKNLYKPYKPRVDKKDKLTSTIISTTSDRPTLNIKTYSKVKSKNAQSQPSPNNISVLPQDALPGTLTPQSNAVMLLPSPPVGFPGSLAAKPPGTPISTPISTSGEAQKPPQFCVVKMDGTDVLLQLVPSSGIGVPGPMVVPKGKTLLVPSVPLVPSSSQLFGQPLRSTLSVTNSTQSMSTPLTSVVTTSQGNISSASLQPLFGIPVISTNSQNVPLPALSIISTISASHLASITSTASIRPLNLTSSGAYISQNSPASLSGHITVMSSLNSRITSVVTSATSSSLSSQVSPAIVTSMAAPNTTTVIRSVRVPGQNLRVITSNQSAALRSVRIFVPGCSAMGTPGHFATIGSLTNSSPLTHLTSSSALLPQRKPSSEPELSAEQRAARRRKLEKKYPLPPGVVIKTEPLDIVTKPSSVVTAVSGSRSLLPQNLHLLSTSRPGGLQSIRIISPSLASALSMRNVRGNSNIIYRAASLGGRQTVLVPTSFRQLSGKTPTAIPSAFITTSSCPSSQSSLGVAIVTAGVATAVTTTKTICTSNTSFIPTDLLSTSNMPSENNIPHQSHSPAPQFALSENTLTNMPAPASESTLEGISLQASDIISCESSLTTNTTATSITTPFNTTCESLNATTVLTNSCDNRVLSPDKQLSDVVTLENFKTSLEKLRKMIQIQEAHGLKGERLQKLLELLHQKEEHYSELQNLRSMSTSPFAAPEDNYCMPGAIIYGNGSQNTAVRAHGHNCSETEPIVID